MKIRVVLILFICGLFFAPLQTARASRANDAYALIAAVNALRAANGLPAYTANPILMATAQQHAEYMAVNGVSHYGTGGTSPYQRAFNAGYPVGGDLSAGGLFSENIIAGANETPEQAVTAWQGDAPHLNTMLSPDLTEIGAGMATANGEIYYVIDCSTPAGGAASSSLAGTVTTPQAGTQSPAAVNTIIPNTPDASGKLYHTVQPGETLWLIAVSYGVKVDDIRRLNGLAADENIYPKTKLLILQLPTPTVTATPTLTPLATYTPVPTWTLQPSATFTPQKVAALNPDSSAPVLGAIVLAALILAGVLAAAMKVRK